MFTLNLVVAIWLFFVIVGFAYIVGIDRGRKITRTLGYNSILW